LGEAASEALAKLVAEAEALRTYRPNGTIYSKKCADFVERIYLFFENLKVESLSEKDLEELKFIKETIFTEEHFAKASFDNRDPEAWKKFLND
jgi:O-methyltransferase involved in polyketide biosynthesis